MWRASNVSRSQNLIGPSLNFQKAEHQYYIQHQKWEQLRNRMKSMQLHKISVTTYIKNNGSNSQNKNKEKPAIRCDTRVQNNQLNDNRYSSDNQLLQQIKSTVKSKQNGVSHRIFTSRSKAHSANKSKKQFLNPYMASAYKLEANRSKINTNYNEELPIFDNIDNPQNKLGQSPQSKTTKNQKRVSNQYVLPTDLQIKLRKRQRNLQKHKAESNSSVSYYKNRDSYPRSNILTHLNNYQESNNKKTSFSNDLIHFCKVSPQDITQRAIIRRKSNINGESIEAIQVSVVKRKIILFIVDITSGNASNYMDLGVKSPTNQFQARSVNFANSGSENKIVSHTPTRTDQLRLMLGPNQVSEYLNILNLSQHPLNLEQSTIKAAMVLVDFLRVTLDGLKIDKKQLLLKFKGAQQDKSNVLEETYRKLQNSQLVRLMKQRTKHVSKSSHQKFITSQYNIIHNTNMKNNDYQHNEEYKANHNDYFKIYGHPHPIINGNQYQKIISCQGQPQQQIEKEEHKNGEPSHQMVQQSMQMGCQVPKTISHNENESKVQEEISESLIAAKSKKSIEGVEEVISQKKTIPVMQEVIETSNPPQQQQEKGNN